MRGPQAPRATHGLGLKGHETFLAAARIVARRFPQARFVLVGNGPNKLGEQYRQSLASFGYAYQPHAWTRDLEVGLLAGGAMRLGWQKALGTQSPDATVRARETQDLEWWSEQIIRAGRWLN